MHTNIHFTIAKHGALLR